MTPWLFTHQYLEANFMPKMQKFSNRPSRGRLYDNNFISPKRGPAIRSTKANILRKTLHSSGRLGLLSQMITQTFDTHNLNIFFSFPMPLLISFWQQMEIHFFNHLWSHHSCITVNDTYNLNHKVNVIRTTYIISFEWNMELSVIFLFTVWWMSVRLHITLNDRSDTSEVKLFIVLCS